MQKCVSSLVFLLADLKVLKAEFWSMLQSDDAEEIDGFRDMFGTVARQSNQLFWQDAKWPISGNDRTSRRRVSDLK